MDEQRRLEQLSKIEEEKRALKKRFVFQITVSALVVGVYFMVVMSYHKMS